MSHPSTYTARVHDEPSGMVWAEVSELPGCFASGSSLEELREALTESSALYTGEELARVGVDQLRLTVPV